MQIRNEEPKDWPAVYKLNVSAFDTAIEANLVDILRLQARPLISMVAEIDNTIVGHIMFSPVTLTEHPDLILMGLAPMAVAPQQQRKGIGSALITKGLVRCTKLGAGAITVLGHPGYYPRFGFKPSSHYGIKCEYEVPEDVFMILELLPGYLNGKTGTIKYQQAFSEVE